VRILYIGPHERARGGIASVIRTYMQRLAGGPCSARHLATLGESGRWGKLFMGMKAYARAPLEILRADIVHIHTASRNSWRRKAPLVILTKLLGRRLVIHIHGGGFGDFLNSMGRRRLRFNTWILSRADRVVCLSPAQRAELATHLRRVPVVTIPNPCRFIPEKVDANPKPGVEILFTGWIEEAKGVFDLIRAFALVVQKCPGKALRLVIAGKGEIDACRQLASACGVEDRVRLPGWLVPPGLQEAYAQADIYCLPSYVEGVPMGVLEAMAFGLPVVASPVGGIPDVVEGGVHGLLVPPGDVDGLALALERLVGSRAERRAMGTAGRERVLNCYSPERVCRELQTLYHSLLTAGPSSRQADEDGWASVNASRGEHLSAYRDGVGRGV
jgi:glycosyltransferase involved in cell wall biosynthesis